MGVKALAHRKRLLKGVAELCAAHRRGAIAPQDPTFGREPPPAPSSIEQGALVRRAHFTRAEPGRAEPCAACAAAARRRGEGCSSLEMRRPRSSTRRRSGAFQEAVAAWRSGERAAVASFTGEMRRFVAGRRIRRGRRAGGLPGGRGGLADARGASAEPREKTSSPKKLNTVGRTANDVADELARQLDAMNAEAEASLRRRRLEAGGGGSRRSSGCARRRPSRSFWRPSTPTRTSRMRRSARAHCPRDDGARSKRGRGRAEAAVFCGTRSESNDDDDAPAYVVDEGSDTDAIATTALTPA